MADWDTGIFDFAISPAICAVSTFCAPCQLAYQLAAIQDRPVSVMDYLYMFACGPCCAVKVRQQIRATYGIDGGLVGDCLWIFLCPPCAVSQQTRQLDIKGLKPAGFLMS